MAVEVVVAVVEQGLHRVIDLLTISFSVAAVAAAVQGIAGGTLEVGGLQLSPLVITHPEVAEVLELLLEEAVVAEEVQAKVEVAVLAEVTVVQVQVVVIRVISTTITTLLPAVVVAVLQ